MAKKKAFEPIGQKQVDESIKLVEKASLPLADVRRLDAAERRRIVKMRKGGAAVVPALIEICTRYGMTVPGVSFDDVSSKLLHAARLAQLERTVAVFLRAIRDEHLSVNGEAWTAARAAYAMLNGAAKADKSIETELAKVHAVFAKPRATKRVSAGKTAAPKSLAANAATTPVLNDAAIGHA